MKLSVVMPVYNVEDYVADAIESVLGQSHQDFELVMVDDGSTDNSLKICERYAKQLGSRSVLVHQENAGLLMARRVGFRVASGEAIVSLDSDDMLRGDALELINWAFTTHGVDMVLYAATRKVGFGSIDLDTPFDSSRLISKDEKLELLSLVCSTSKVNSMCGKAIVRERVDVDNGYERYRGLNYGEDLLQSLALFDNINDACYIHEPLYYYRVNYKSLTKKFNEQQIRDREAVGNLRMEYAKKWADEYSSAELERGALSSWVESYAQVAQAVCEGLSYRDAVILLKDLSQSKYFLDAYRKVGSGNNIRPDFSLFATLLAGHRYTSLWTISRAKGIARKVLAKR